MISVEVELEGDWVTEGLTDHQRNISFILATELFISIAISPLDAG